MRAFRKGAMVIKYALVAVRACQDKRLQPTHQYPRRARSAPAAQSVALKRQRTQPSGALDHHVHPQRHAVAEVFKRHLHQRPGGDARLYRRARGCQFSSLCPAGSGPARPGGCRVRQWYGQTQSGSVCARSRLANTIRARGGRCSSRSRARSRLHQARAARAAASTGCWLAITPPGLPPTS